MVKIIKYNFTEINANPLKYIIEKDCKEKDIQKILELASASYYSSSNELLSDPSFDILKDYFETQYPNNPFLQQIGADIQGPNKVKLPVHMGSMDKKKIEKDINNWIKKYPTEVVISDKLDGISFLLVINKGKQTLLTRGNGSEGKDISKLIAHLRLPKINDKLDIIIRGEMLVSRDNFLKVKDKFSNGRSFIAGLSNFKELTKDRIQYLKLVDLVCYELIKPNLQTSKQLEYLNKLGYQVVNHSILPEVKYGLLQNVLVSRKEKSKYDIDGIIVTSNQINPRVKTGNPKYSFAFKMDLEFAVTKVVRVEWNASKHGKLKPLVILEPVVLCGTNNGKATGNNADFIEKNKIGPGAIVKIIKGGEIIPKIEEVIKGTKPQFPEVEYQWNATHKEIVLLDMENDSTKIKKIINFFKTIEIDGLGPGIIKKFYENGYDTIGKICLLTEEKLLLLEGIKQTMATKIVSNIKKILSKPIPLEKIVAGTCLLGDGLGEKILKKIFQHFKIKTISDLDKMELVKLKEISGIEEKTAIKILNNIGKIKSFLLEHKYLKFTVELSSTQTTGKFLNQGVVLSGKRDSEIIDFIKLEGGEIKSVINKNTAFVIVDNMDLGTSKIKKALELKIKIYTSQDFKKEYL